MAEESGKVLEDRLEIRLSRLEEGQQTLREDVSRLNGVVEQMDRRLSSIEQRISNVEQGQRWIMGLIFGAWITLMLAILGPYLKG